MHIWREDSARLSPGVVDDAIHPHSAANINEIVGQAAFEVVFLDFHAS